MSNFSGNKMSIVAFAAGPQPVPTVPQPLECRYCHHDRQCLGPKCHADIGKEWNTSAGRALVAKWSKISGFWKRLNG